MITIDGATEEGLRTSLSLAAITGKEVRFERIGAKRRLMRQHLAWATAVAEICGGELSGAELGSQELVFKPGAIRGANIGL